MTLPYVFQLFDFFHVFHGLSRSLVGVVAIFAPTTTLLSVCLNKSNFTNSVVHTVEGLPPTKNALLQPHGELLIKQGKFFIFRK